MLAKRMPSTAMPRMKSSETMRSSEATGRSGAAPPGAGSSVVVLAFMTVPRVGRRSYAWSAVGHKAVVARLLERSTSGVRRRARGIAAGLELGDAPRADHQPLFAGKLGAAAQPAPEPVGVARHREGTELHAPRAARGGRGHASSGRGRGGARRGRSRRSRSGRRGEPRAIGTGEAGTRVG